LTGDIGLSANKPERGSSFSLSLSVAAFFLLFVVVDVERLPAGGGCADDGGDVISDTCGDSLRATLVGTNPLPALALLFDGEDRVATIVHYKCQYTVT